MQTSYFAKYKGEHGVSIARWTQWFSGPRYPILAPPNWLITKYKAGKISDEDYTKAYIREVLDGLNPHEVYKELGDNAVLLCFEKPPKFCHRHIVSEWFNKHGIPVTEIA